jgi:subtilisin family serine protease
VSNPKPCRSNSIFGIRAKKERRPTGVSRKRKKQLGFETLESRQVMSASAIVPPPMLYASGGSASNATEQGQLDILAQELYWYSLMASVLPEGSYKTAAVPVPPNDPLFNSQWHILNSGQQVGNPDFQDIYGVAGEDLNLAPVWAMGLTGAGVTIAVHDNGVQINHPDLVDNLNLDLAIDTLNPAGNGNPFFFGPNAGHGTAIAGLIGAVTNNGIGGAGVAPGATLVPVRVLADQGVTFQQAFVDAFRHAIQEIDITNNSFEPLIPRSLPLLAPEVILALRDSIIFGRGGLGQIHVFSAGNDAGTGFAAPGAFEPIGFLDSSAYNPFINSRYTIGVTAVDHDGFYNNFDGTHTGYAETSSAVLVAAPSSSNYLGNNIADDTGLGSGLFTTDLTGEFGYNIAPDPVTGQEFDRDYLDDTDYTSRFGGTSSAAAMASGVIALMLEANPNLTWRDVQEILVRSARQNAPIEVPQNGFEQGHVVDGTQNLWITNQMPVFHDPDPFFANIPVPLVLRIFFPTLDPNITNTGDDPTDPDFRTMHYNPTPITMTNGAGYTVAMGRGSNGELIGYGHGVIDAEMAVLLAQQWHTKDQALPNERTFTSFVLTPGNDIDGGLIPAREVSNDATGNLIVPGGLGGEAGFIGFWNEYARTDRPPFSDPGHGPENTRGTPLFLTVPDSNTMSIESVEVKLSISGGTAGALDHLRVLLVSPDGTHSELNDFYVQPAPVFSLQNGSFSTFILDGVGSVDNGGDLIWTFSTKRSWGERSDNALVYNPVTGEPMINTTGIAPLSGLHPTPSTPATIGAAIEQGWQLHFENYGTTALELNAVEVVWHGSPVEAESQRVQGFIGVDDDRNGLFNYSRLIQSQIDIPFDTANTLRYSEVVAEVDLNQESFAGNVTVTATRVSDGVVVDQFVTGHDGNFYFDLVPDTYIISIEDPEGRTAVDDSLNLPGVLDHYRTEWVITPEFFKVWDHVDGAPTDVVADANGVPVAWLDANLDETPSGMKGINFLLDPGEIATPEATFTGSIIADTNGDGVFNGNDVVLSNVGVYGDVNRNGTQDPGEVIVESDASGNYTLVIPDLPPASVINVGVVLPTNWTATNPAGGLHTRFVTPGDEFGSVNFFIKPPANNIGGGGVEAPGILAGVVFNDFNGNGQRDNRETGILGVPVYLDANNNATLDAGETSTLTNQFGAYAFTDVAPGQQVIRIIVSSPLLQTVPASGTGNVVNLTGSSTISTLNFGVQDLAVLDFGDLPDDPLVANELNRYESRVGAGGALIYDPARHTKGGFWLGATIDGELTAAPSANADGDDLAGDVDDENGIVVDPIVAGSSLRIVATANTFSGYLQGWIDWNNDGDFLDEGERVVTDQLLVQGANQLFINAPLNIAAGNVYARFRYGEASHDPFTGLPRAIDTPFGRAATGEVEDYLLPVADQGAPLVVGLPADFDQDADVDGRDFLTWQRNAGTTTGAKQSQGSVNGDGMVNALDLNVWSQQFGATAGSAASATGMIAARPARGSYSGVAQSGQPTQYASLVAQGLVPFSLDRILAASWLSSLSGAASASVVTVTPATGADLQGETLSRPELAKVAGKLSDVADRLRQASDRADARFSAVRETVREAISEVADRAETGDLDTLRRDRAFDDLFNSRHRKRVLAELEAELTDEADADDAFAALAEHFLRARG